MTTLRTATVEDSRDMAKLHAVCLPGGLLTRLGVLPAYYRWLIGRSITISMWEGHQLVGVVVAGPLALAQPQFIASHRWLLVRRLLARPWLMVDGQVVRMARRFGTRTPAAAPGISGFRILSLIVDPAHSGQGIARLLVECATRTGRLSGYRQVTLTAHPGARGFYSNLGFVPLDDAQMTKPL